MNYSLVLPLFIYMLILFTLGLIGRKLFKIEGEFTQEYFVGGRAFGGVFIAFTLSATFITSGTVLGVAEVAYNSGLNWVYLMCGQICMGWAVLGILGKKFAIIARRINAVTLVDFIRHRYQSKPLVILVSIGLLLFMGVFMVAQLVGGARIMEAATGLDYHLGLIVFAVVVLVYTTVGGFRAVVYADFLQGSVILIGGITVFFSALRLAGGFGSITAQLAAISPELVTLPGGDDLGTFWWAISLSSLLVAVVVMPHTAVRAMAYKSSKAMHRAIIIGTIITAIITWFFGFMGPMARVLVPGLEASVLAVPMLIIEVMPPIIAGIILGAPIAAMISSVDSMLLVIASSIVKDLYYNYFKPAASNMEIKRITYLAMLIIGVIIVFIASYPPEVLQFLVLFSTGGFGVVLVTPILFGLYWKKANSSGCAASIIGGMLTYIALGLFGGGGYHPYAPAFIVSVLLMVLVSQYTKRPADSVIKVFWGKPLNQHKI